ncbi:metal-sensing transcriptional repressor [Planococcus lenghuensis]|uniref:Cytoplasmic protein n=1 Tax=Planococcus lenghuensis TaxID=2213202 RepID=A0A1Q2L430_9BACL|nr:metal-sensing transcriptional repressor [Planococcus lenghuensis]AQQ55189.1 cytoplasmic protein [Planococcus lenghuensis]
MKYDGEVMDKLRQIEGGIKSILHLMENEAECKNVAEELVVIRNTVDEAIGTVVGGNLQQCLVKRLTNGEESAAVMKEAVDLLIRSK